MNTLLVDACGRLADLERVRPFWYPLQQAGTLRLLPVSRTPWPERAEAVRLDVLRSDWKDGDWQLLFLLDITVAGGGIAEGSLAGQLAAIKADVVEDLKAHRLYPRQVWAVAIDDLEREPHTGRPLDPQARKQWMLDARGWVTGVADGALFTTSDLGALKGMAVEQIPAAVQELAKGHARVALAHEPPPALVRIERYREALQRFSRRLAATRKRDIARATPQAVLADSLSRTFSLRAFSGDVFLLRFPLRERRRAVGQRAWLELAYTLGVLASHEALGTDFRDKRERHPLMPIHTVAEVRIDEGALQAVAGPYQAQLTKEAQRLQAGVSGHGPVHLTTYRDDQCACYGGNHRPDLSTPRYGWFQRHDDRGRWSQWLAGAQEKLDDAQREGRARVQDCLADVHKPPPSEAEEYANLATVATARHASFESARRSLIAQPFPKSASPPLTEAMAGVMRRVRDVLDIRHRPQRFIVNGILGTLIFFIPPALQLWKGAPTDWDYRVMIAGLMVLVLVAAIAALYAVARRLRKALTAAHTVAANVALNQERVFEQQRAYVGQLCRTRVARLNDAVAQDAQRATAERVLYEKHHADQIRLHQRKISGLAVDEEAATDPPSAPAIIPGTPPEANAAYAPISYAGREIPAYTVQVGSADIAAGGSALPGLQRLVLREDAVLLGNMKR